MPSSLKKRYAIDELNARAAQDAAGFVADCEQAYRTRVDRVAESIRTYGQRVVFLAGPSSSGKTTTAKVLSACLARRSIQSATISLDDFLLDHDRLPRFADGSIDYDSLDTLDVDGFRRCIEELLETGKTRIPRFDFLKGGRSGDTELLLDRNHVVIVEGIHALNERIIGTEQRDRCLKLYISVKSEYYADGKRLLNSRDTRLMRRLIRDAFFRGSDANNTLDMWQKVCEGEELYIRPLRETADFWLDSAHLYEPLIYKPYLLSVLRCVKPNSRFADEAARLRAIIQKFDRMSSAVVPQDSMIREFIGNRA